MKKLTLEKFEEMLDKHMVTPYEASDQVLVDLINEFFHEENEEAV